MKSKLPILLPILILLILVIIFFNRIPFLGSGDLGIYPFALFVLIMFVLALKNIIPGIKDYINYMTGFNFNGSKLLFFRGYSAGPFGGDFTGSRGYGGYSRIKLSDGRKIKIWSSPFAGEMAKVFYFKGARNKGELRREKIIINGNEYMISSDTSEITINFNNANYAINDSTSSISKNGIEIAKFIKFPSGTYIEVANTSELTKEEFLLINLFLMDIYLLYVSRLIVAV